MSKQMSSCEDTKPPPVQDPAVRATLMVMWTGWDEHMGLVYEHRTIRSLFVVMELFVSNLQLLLLFKMGCLFGQRDPL